MTEPNEWIVMLAALAGVLWVMFLEGCAIDMRNRPKTMPPSIRLGLYVEDGISIIKAAQIFDEIRAALLDIGVETYLAWLVPVERNGFGVDAKLDVVRKLPGRDADKVLLLVNPTASDIVMAALIPYPMGKAEIGGDDAVAWDSGWVAVHEVLHLMGYRH